MLNLQVIYDDVWGSEDIPLPFLILALVGGESEISAISAGKELQYSLDWRMDGLLEWCGCSEEVINLLHLLGIKPKFLGCAACSPLPY
jgi:hypothetical protein